MANNQQSVQSWIGVVVSTIPVIGNFIDLFRRTQTVDGLPCQLKYKGRKDFTKCKHCGLTFDGMSGAQDSPWPKNCPNSTDE